MTRIKYVAVPLLLFTISCATTLLSERIGAGTALPASHMVFDPGNLGPELSKSVQGKLSESLRGFDQEFVLLPAGEFMLGCSPGDQGCAKDEKPPHQVRITRPFEIGKYEVTQAQWEAVMGSNPSHFKGAERPVEQVSWNDIQLFLSRLNEKRIGYRYRLPTEAEWEYAARAGTAGPFAGNLDEVGWYSHNSGRETHPVGRKKPNAWGLYDMRGNVWEWCQDWYDAKYYLHSPTADPQGPSSGTMKVLRGGCWLYLARNLRASTRNRSMPANRSPLFGFRCVRQPIP